MGQILVAILIVAFAGSARASGRARFSANCAVCHQAEGNGVAGIYPPLAGTVGAYLRVPDGRAYLVHVVAFGMTGAISSRGNTYNGFMQPWPKFSDREIAELLNYLLTAMNAKLLPADFKPYTAAEVARLRAAKLGFDEVHAERAALMKALVAQPAHSRTGS